MIIKLSDPQLEVILRVLDDYISQDLDATGQVSKVLQDLETTRGLLIEEII